jgi:hypothetical protein
MVTCQLYQANKKKEWDEFVSVSKTPLFMFKRDFVEYHADRFVDMSLMFYENGSLVALLPASLADGVLISHGGLTYGGVVVTPKARMDTIFHVFDELVNFSRNQKFRKIIYKAVPHIFSEHSAQEDLYIMHALGAKLFRRDLSSVIYLKNRQKLSKGRRALISRANKNGLVTSVSYDWEGFHALLCSVLEKHGAAPVHSSAELAYLASKFPENIQLKVVMSNDEIVAGTLLFKFNHVVHTQYLAVSESGKEVGALDLLLESCIAESAVNGSQYFSFGISTEKMGTVVNSGLLSQKESFGARGLAIDFYEINLND